MLEVGICSSFWSPKLIRLFHWCSNLVIVLAREDVNVHLQALPTITEQFPAVWIGALSSWKTAPLFGNVWIMRSTWLQNLFTYSLVVIRPWRLIMGLRDYCTTILLPNHHRISLLFQCWNQAFQTEGFLECSPDANSSWCRDQREGQLIWPYHVRVSSCLMFRFYVSSHHRLRTWALLSVIRESEIAPLL
jgi:hypothetical protein